MKSRTFYAAVFATGALLAVATPVRAGDTMRLGVGSLTGAGASYAAPTVTLKGSVESKADTQDVIFHPYARGYYHGANGFAYRPWVGFYRPFVRAFTWGFYRPYAFYQPYYYNYYPALAYSNSCYYPISTSVAVTVPSVTASIPPTAYGSSAPPAYAAPLATMTGTEMLPTPRVDETFRYDGGPAAPVPMPDGTRLAPMTPPIPYANVPAISRVQAQPATTKIAYPAYGEELPRPRPANAGPILVKNPGQK